MVRIVFLTSCFCARIKGTSKNSHLARCRVTALGAERDLSRRKIFKSSKRISERRRIKRYVERRTFFLEPKRSVTQRETDSPGYCIQQYPPLRHGVCRKGRGHFRVSGRTPVFEASASKHRPLGTFCSHIKQNVGPYGFRHRRKSSHSPQRGCSWRLLLVGSP